MGIEGKEVKKAAPKKPRIYRKPKDGKEASLNMVNIPFNIGVDRYKENLLKSIGEKK